MGDYACRFLSDWVAEWVNRSRFGVPKKLSQIVLRRNCNDFFRREIPGRIGLCLPSQKKVGIMQATVESKGQTSGGFKARSEDACVVRYAIGLLLMDQPATSRRNRFIPSAWESHFPLVSLSSRFLLFLVTSTDLSTNRFSQQGNRFIAGTR